MSVSKEVFCEVMYIAYEINCRHPDWSMDKCIEYAVKGAYAITDQEKQASLVKDQSNLLISMSCPSCRDCRSFVEKPSERCSQRGFEFYREEEMRETAKRCYGFKSSKSDREPVDEFMQPPALDYA